MAKPKLKDCPPGGTGCHNWLFYAACRCVEAEMDDESAEAYITPLMSREPAPLTEVADALAAARREGKEPTQRWPGRKFDLIQEIFKDPLPAWKPTGITAEVAVDVLFPGNPLLCIGKTSSNFNTKPREGWRGYLGNNSLIVPSPMTGRQGRTKAGYLSSHSLDNTGSRRYLITEWDWPTHENQLRLIKHLEEFGTLAAIVHSGGKSTHGWWDVRGEPEEKVKEFFAYAVTLGADPRLWLRSQFCRIPGGVRDNGNRQEILFLDR